jgi:hypothetical protein
MDLKGAKMPELNDVGMLLALVISGVAIVGASFIWSKKTTWEIRILGSIFTIGTQAYLLFDTLPRFFGA